MILANATLLRNVLALAGSTLVTSALGFVFWGVATRMFEPTAVGLASAAVSLMTLLSTVGLLGLDTLMISELPVRTGKRGVTLATALVASLAACLVIWVAIVVGGGFLGSGDAGMLRLTRSAIFGVGVAFGAVGMILDQSLVGLLRGNVQLWRNATFAVVKLIALIPLGLFSGTTGGGDILLAWVGGIVVSLIFLMALFTAEGTRILYLPKWEVITQITGETLKHHVLNLALFGPRLILPVLVSVLVAADANAAFYASLMIVSIGFMIPAHFSTVLHAVGVASQALLGERLKFSLRSSIALSLAAVALITLTAPYLLSIFGQYYAETAKTSLQILAWTIPGMAVKFHFVAVQRVRNRVGHAAAFMTLGAVLEVGLAAGGALIAGIEGLSVGYALSTTIQAVPCMPTLLREIRGASKGRGGR